MSPSRKRRMLGHCSLKSFLHDTTRSGPDEKLDGLGAGLEQVDAQLGEAVNNADMA
jgi:hypothetical protein